MNFNFSCYTDLLGLILSTSISLKSLSFAFTSERWPARERILDWQVFPSCALKGWSTVALLALFSVRNLMSASPLSFRMEHVFFPLPTFKIIFFFIIDFDQFKHVWVYSFCQIWKILAINFSNLYLSPLCFRFSNYMCVRLLGIGLRLTEAYSILFTLFSLHFHFEHFLLLYSWVH